MKTNKCLFILFFIVLSFLFINNVQADYEATVLNPTNATCHLKSSSTGYCYYKDSSLSSIGGVWYLDTGDKVTVLTDYESIPTFDINTCSDYYVYTSFYFDSTGKTYNGYYCNANLKGGSFLTDELKEEFKNAGFPESYFEKLAILKTAHPNWVFKAISTKLDFNESVNGEHISTRSLVEISASNNYAYLENDSMSFDYKEDHFIGYDRTNSDNPFCKANKGVIAYYMDPRNFLSDMYIFQFEGLSYDKSVSDDVLTNSINSMFGDDYLSRFTADFINAGKESGVSPVYLAALSKQEVSNGPTPGTAISGSYNGMYNFYNIGAYSGYNPAITGLEFAAFNDPNTRRPWNSEYKAIVGGALWMADKYISVGQNTSHFKRFNVLYNYLIELGEVKDPYVNFQHQWMTNVLAPASEAISSYKSYYNSGLIDSSFVFYIPVYENMPDSTSLPDKQGWPNNYLSNITINSDAIAGFDGDIEEYNYYLDRNTKSINIKANPVNESAKIEGLGEFKIDKDTTKNIKVTAQNGNVKTYKINIILTGKEIENPIDIKTTLNNAGIKNNDSYLSGFVVGYDMQYIKDKIKNANKSAVVTLKNRNGEEKNSGFIATGDKVTITVSDETKEFEVVVYGDVNGDGMIKATDYVLIKNQIMGNSTLQGPYKEAADVDKNGMIKATDYVKIKNQIMGLGTIEQ